MLVGLGQVPEREVSLAAPHVLVGRHQGGDAPVLVPLQLPQRQQVQGVPRGRRRRLAARQPVREQAALAQIDAVARERLAQHVESANTPSVELCALGRAVPGLGKLPRNVGDGKLAEHDGCHEVGVAGEGGVQIEQVGDKGVALDRQARAVGSVDTRWEEVRHAQVLVQDRPQVIWAGRDSGDALDGGDDAGAGALGRCAWPRLAGAAASRLVILLGRLAREEGVCGLKHPGRAAARGAGAKR